MRHSGSLCNPLNWILHRQKVKGRVRLRYWRTCPRSVASRYICILRNIREDEGARKNPTILIRFLQCGPEKSVSQDQVNKHLPFWQVRRHRRYSDKVFAESSVDEESDWHSSNDEADALSALFQYIAFVRYLTNHYMSAIHQEFPAWLCGEFEAGCHPTIKFALR